LISSKFEHAPFETVHLKMYEFPATPENVVLLIFGFPKLPPEPDVTDHNPVPAEGFVADNVKLVNPHVDNPV
jgi:hypothetical protein